MLPVLLCPNSNGINVLVLTVHELAGNLLDKHDLKMLALCRNNMNRTLAEVYRSI